MTITLRPTPEQEALLDSVMDSVNQSTKTKTLMHVLKQYQPLVEQIEHLRNELKERNQLLEQIKAGLHMQEEAKQLLDKSLNDI